MAERLLKVEILRGKHKAPVGRARWFKDLTTAPARMTRFLIEHGKVGDVCEMHHVVTGLQLATVKMTARGQIVTDFVWEKRMKLYRSVAGAAGRRVADHRRPTAT